MQFGELALQGNMQMMGARDIASPARTRTHVECRLAQGFENRWVLALRKVIIRTPHNDSFRPWTIIARIWVLSCDPRQVGKDPIAILVPYRAHGFRKDLFVVHVDHLRLPSPGPPWHHAMEVCRSVPIFIAWLPAGMFCRTPMVSGSSGGRRKSPI